MWASQSPIGQRAFEEARRAAFLLGVRKGKLRAEDPADWHTSVFTPLGCQPVDRIGCYRSSENHLTAHVFAEGVATPSWITSLPELVDIHVEELVDKANQAMAQAAELTKAQVFAMLPVLSAEMYSGWLRVHPFCDGNGRTGVCLVDWLCGAVGAFPYMLRSTELTMFYGRRAEESVRLACQKASNREMAPLTSLFAGELELALRVGRGSGSRDGNASED